MRWSSPRYGATPAAAVVLIAHDGETILTSDTDDIRTLAAAANRTVATVHC